MLNSCYTQYINSCEVWFIFRVSPDCPGCSSSQGSALGAAALSGSSLQMPGFCPGSLARFPGSSTLLQNRPCKQNIRIHTAFGACIEHLDFAQGRLHDSQVHPRCSKIGPASKQQHKHCVECLDFPQGRLHGAQVHPRCCKIGPASQTLPLTLHLELASDAWI